MVVQIQLDQALILSEDTKAHILKEVSEKSSVIQSSTLMLFSSLCHTKFSHKCLLEAIYCHQNNTISMISDHTFLYGYRYMYTTIVLLHLCYWVRDVVKYIYLEALSVVPKGRPA